VAEGRAQLAEGATPTRISACVPVALGPDEATARQLAAWWLTTYATRMGPIYPRLLGERFGMGAALAAVVDAAPELPAEAEELARDVTLMATYDEAATAIERWFAEGVDSVQLVLPPGRPEEELAQIVEVAAHRLAV
jgi:alkanesulfonate monooxygenase SsuD/methylene tetrahydromethanopterin reductase-like flavin-dependent oxidoreductase (luciferase family)